jgi:hypothetical protein
LFFVITLGRKSAVRSEIKPGLRQNTCSVLQYALEEEGKNKNEQTREIIKKER